jgi:hypothetical protein
MHPHPPVAVLAFIAPWCPPAVKNDRYLMPADGAVGGKKIQQPFTFGLQVNPVKRPPADQREQIVAVDAQAHENLP